MKRTKPIAAGLALFAGLGATVAFAAPFTMDERPSQPEAIIQPGSPPAIGPEAAPKTEAPAVGGGGVGSEPVGSQVAQRAILPAEMLRLNGELDLRSWDIDLTRSEADSPATLTMGYKSALVVAPETSRLRVFLNDRLALGESNFRLGGHGQGVEQTAARFAPCWPKHCSRRGFAAASHGLFGRLHLRTVDRIFRQRQRVALRLGYR